MIKFSNNLLSAMNAALGEITVTSENNLQRAERSYQVVQDTIQQLKDFILKYDFKDKLEEIEFFKEVKPAFLRELIYYLEVFYIEANKPVGKEKLSAFYNLELERINTFFERNQPIYMYYRMAKSNCDEQFFLRNTATDQLMPDYSPEMDPRFSTLYSFKFGKIQAFEQLIEYLQHTLFALDHPEVVPISIKGAKYHNLWTDSKASLIELAYAIHSRGSVNNGKGDVKQLITDLELLFNVQVGNFYRTFQSMRIRKKSRTPFLDTLKESLEKKMDSADMSF